VAVRHQRVKAGKWNSDICGTVKKKKTAAHERRQFYVYNFSKGDSRKYFTIDSVFETV
jgi:hypothetical protein